MKYYIGQRTDGHGRYIAEVVKTGNGDNLVRIARDYVTLLASTRDKAGRLVEKLNEVHKAEGRLLWEE